MKQVFTLINDLVRNARVPYLNDNGMKFYKILFLFCLVAFTIINSSFTKEIRQSSAETAYHLEGNVPFKGKVSVSLGVGVTSGKGVGSHIGRFEYASVDDFSTFPFVTGSATITAANGDELFTTFSGDLGDIGNGMLSVSFENIITGGTGRFEGATGSFTSTGTANTSKGTANTTFAGTISY
ncbi:MAG: hypothetical protein WKF91_03905 [Segetibacter sp.]